MENSIELGIDPGRLLFGLSRIGYTTSSALCDIIDNSVRAGASNISVIIKKEREDLSDTRKNNVKEYIIVDNGKGMNEIAIKEALKLGSSEEFYETHSLSKFGLGLKSAAFSQADILQVISSDSSGSFVKYRVSLPDILREKRYFATKEELDETDNLLITEHLLENKGTIIRLCNIRRVNHPSVKNTIWELNLRVGVIYYYFLSQDGLAIKIGENTINAIDPLFVSEADKNGNLNENEWDGKIVKWIEKPKELTLDDQASIKATIEITQLPYPPVFKLDGHGKDVAIREKYLIGSGNYGFYVYRNKRLIAWASGLQGIIPSDQDYFAFRGRILIDDSADDYFNIDIKKSTLTLSEEAWNVISDTVQEAKSKSKKAWQNAGRKLTDATNLQPNEISNKLIYKFEQIDLLPGDQEPQEDEVKRRAASLKSDMEDKVKIMAKLLKQDKGEEIVAEETATLTEETKLEAITGKVNPKESKIFRVTSIEDNLLWEPYHDTDFGVCVRINKYHRFARYIYEDNIENPDLQVIFELMLLQLSESEVYSYKNITGFKYDDLKRMLTENRRITSEFLANMVRKLGDVLPPNYIKMIYD